VNSLENFISRSLASQGGTVLISIIRDPDDFPNMEYSSGRRHNCGVVWRCLPSDLSDRPAYVEYKLFPGIWDLRVDGCIHGRHIIFGLQVIHDHNARISSEHCLEVPPAALFTKLCYLLGSEAQPIALYVLVTRRFRHLSHPRWLRREDSSGLEEALL